MAVNKKGISSISVILVLILIAVIGGGGYYLGVHKNNATISQLPTPTSIASPSVTLKSTPSFTPEPTQRSTPKSTPTMASFENADFSLEYPSNWYLDSIGGGFSLSALPYTSGDFTSAVIQSDGPISYADSLDKITQDWIPTYSTIILLSDFNTPYAQSKKLITDDSAHKGLEKDTISTVIALYSGSKYYILHMIYDKGDAQGDYFQGVIDQIARSFKIK